MIGYRNRTRDECVARRWQAQELADALPSHRVRDRKLLELRRQNVPAMEIAERLGISKARVYQLEAAAWKTIHASNDLEAVKRTETSRAERAPAGTAEPKGQHRSKTPWPHAPRGQVRKGEPESSGEPAGLRYAKPYCGERPTGAELRACGDGTKSAR